MAHAEAAETAPTFEPVVSTRRGSLRAKAAAARAKLAHSSHGGSGRQIIAYLTKPLMDRLRWYEGGLVRVMWADAGDAMLLRFAPAHKGIAAKRDGKTTSTCRLVISGDFIARSVCAPVRQVEYSVESDFITLKLPREWLSRDMIRTTAPVGSAA